jgi:hypothetical protein
VDDRERKKRHPPTTKIGGGRYAVAAQILDAHHLCHGVAADGLSLETMER